MAIPIMLEIDSSELDALCARLQSALTPARVDQVMAGIFRRTEGHVRKILREDIPPRYHVKAGEVAKSVGRGRVTGGAGGAGGVGCVIPVRGGRKSIGGGFSASGGAHGWNVFTPGPRGGRRKRYRIKSKIVKAKVSTLPQTMEHYGGMPPFRNLSAPKLNGVAFTRAGKKRFPIMKVVGIAIPQMPLNRSKEAVERDIASYLEKRMEHELQRLVGG